MLETWCVGQGVVYVLEVCKLYETRRVCFGTGSDNVKAILTAVLWSMTASGIGKTVYILIRFVCICMCSW